MILCMYVDVRTVARLGKPVMDEQIDMTSDHYFVFRSHEDVKTIVRTHLRLRHLHLRQIH